MTTLRDLSYMIEANTEGMNKAFPALNKLVDSLERLSDTVQALNTNFAKSAKGAGDTSKVMADTVVKSSDRIRTALERQQAFMISASQRLSSLNKMIKDSGGGSDAIDANIKAFQDLDKVMKDTNATAGQIAIARSKFNTTLAQSREKLHALNDAQREQVAVDNATLVALERLTKGQKEQADAAKRSAAQIEDSGRKSQASLMGLQNKMNGLNKAMKASGVDDSFITGNISAYAELEKVLSDSSTTVGQAALARQKYNIVIDQSRQALKTQIELERQAAEAAKKKAQANSAASRIQAQANAANSKQGQKQADFLTRNQAALISAQGKVGKVAGIANKSGADAKITDAATAAYDQLEKTLTDVTKTSAEVTHAKAVFNKRLLEITGSLRDYISQTKTAEQATRSSSAAQLKQDNTLARLTIQFENLNYSLEKMGAHPGRIAKLSAAFGELQADLKDGVLDADKLSKAVNKFNSVVAEVKRGEGFTTMSDRMSDLASTAQVALGPLSGVASRITAITTLANRNTIAIAGLIGAFVGFTLSMGRAIVLGAQFEKQMAQIDAILKVTGNQIGMSVSEIESVVQRVASSVRSTESEVRDAAASLLTFRNVTKKVYEGALLAAQGLALIARGDINSQIRNIGRTLDDPINNLTSLTESGVSFNAMEQEQIKLLQMSGKLYEAQDKIMQRVSTVIAAAKGEVVGLSGAWKKLLQTFDNYLRTTGQGAALMQTFTNIVNMLAERFKQLSNNAAVTEGLMRGMKLAASILATTVELLVTHFDSLVGIMAAFVAVRAISFVFGLNKAFKEYKKTLEVTALVQGLVTGGIKGLLTIAAGITAIKLYEWHMDASDAADGQAKSLLDLDERLRKVKGSAEQLNRFRDLTIKAQTKVDDGEAAAAAIKKANKAAIQDAWEQQGLTNSPHPGAGMARAGAAMGAMVGTKQPELKMTQQDIDKAIKMAETDVNAAINFLEQKMLQVVGVVKGARRALSGELAIALNDFVGLKDKHMPLIAAEQELQAEMLNVAEKSKLMTEALIQGGKTFEEASNMVELLTMNLEANGNATRQYITDIRKSITQAQNELKVTKAVGNQKRELMLSQNQLNALYEAGILKTADSTKELEKLRTLGYGPLIDEILRLKGVLESVEFDTKVAEMTKGLEDNVKLMSQQAALAGKSEYEQASAMSVLEQKIKMLNMGIKENSAEWNRAIQLVKQLTDLDFARQHGEAMKSMQMEAQMQGVIMDNMFKSEGTRNRAIALAEKQNELVQKYGDLTNANAQAELELFKVVQERQRIMDEWQQVANVIENAFDGAEDAIVEFAKTGKLEIDKLASSILEDIFRMTLKMTITDPLKDMLGGVMKGITGGGAKLPGLGGYSMTNPLPVYVTNSGVEGLTNAGTDVADPWNGLRKIGDKITKGTSDAVKKVSGELPGAATTAGAALPKIDELTSDQKLGITKSLTDQKEWFKKGFGTIPVERQALPDIGAAMPKTGRLNWAQPFGATPEQIALKNFDGGRFGDMATKGGRLPQGPTWENPFAGSAATQYADPKAANDAADALEKMAKKADSSIGAMTDSIRGVNMPPMTAKEYFGPNVGSLPAGMRNNNPGNIKFVGQTMRQGVVGPSLNTDQGDPQAVFTNPQAGMDAMAKLALKKFNAGQTSVDELIAKTGAGWTPGNHQAAANVAKGMGVDPYQQIDLRDKGTMDSFLKNLVKQEHGAKGALYPDEMYSRSIDNAYNPSMNDNFQALPETGPIPQFKALNDNVAQANNSVLKFSDGLKGSTDNIMKSAQQFDLKKFGGGRQSDNVIDMTNPSLWGKAKHELDITKDTFFPKSVPPIAADSPLTQGIGLDALSNPNYNPGFQWDPSTFAGPTKDSFFKDIGWGNMGGQQASPFMGGAQPFMGGAAMPGQMGSMPFSGMGAGSAMGMDGAGLGSLTTSVESLKTSFTGLSDTIPSLTTNLTSGFDNLASSASSLADGSIAKAATGLNTFSDQALTSAVTSQMQTTTQTTTMGLASAATSAQVTALGAASSSAAAQMGASSAGGLVTGLVAHGGGIVGGSGPGVALMSGGGFANAPRLHGGLHPNEFRAILKRGEGVFTEDQMDMMGNAIDRNGNPTGGNPNGASSGLGNTSGGPVTIILQGVKDYDSFKKSEAQFKAGAASVAQRAQQRQG